MINKKKNVNNMHIKLAGVVILYHPDDNVMKNIDSYIHDVDILYILDNTESHNTEFENKIKRKWPDNKYKYIAFYENKGISFCLNYALKRAQKFDFLLTMDQDSKFLEGMLEKYKKSILNLYRYDVAMYAVNLDMKYIPPLQGNDGNNAKIVETAITSGSILNVKIATELNGFDENLFIDEVDLDFCHKADLQGYKIIQFMNVLLYHEIGEPKLRRFIWKYVIVSNHSAIRKYYIVRNRIYMMQKYPFLKKKYIKSFIKVFAYTILYEKNKLRKLHYIIMGIGDAINERMGSFNQWHK